MRMNGMAGDGDTVWACANGAPRAKLNKAGRINRFCITTIPTRNFQCGRGKGVPSMLHIDPQTLDYPLPEQLIAQEPLKQRDKAQLLVVDRSTSALAHGVFTDLAELLGDGDVLVINQAKVSRAKLIGQKSTGGKVEVICISPWTEPNMFRA